MNAWAMPDAACGPARAPVVLAAIVEKMLEKDVKDRYTRIADVRRDLEGLEQASAASVAVAVPPSAPGPSFAAGMRRLLPSLLTKASDKKT